MGMEYRQLGGSKVKVSAVTLGTWAIGGWMWGGTDDEKAVEAIRAAVDAGVTSIDTAPMYGFGHSEKVVGQAIAGRRDKVKLLTKYGMRWDLEEGQFWFKTKMPDGSQVPVHRCAKAHSVIEECERSLKRLGTDRIDVFQCHWRDNTTPVAETMKAVDKLLKDGKILAAGVSNFSVEEIEAAAKVVPLASDQPPYSMLRRDIEADVLPYCREHNIGLVVYSPLHLGLLTGKVTMDRQFTGDDQRANSPYYRPANRRKVLDFLEQIRPIAEGHGATLAQLVINWTIHRPGITCALVGARNPQQAVENAGAAGFKLTAEETARIDEALDGVKLDLGR
jgi:aryl-alcohol dehydrogenase-like predicted oxidoreductase